jgi:hypothetical protein
MNEASIGDNWRSLGFCALVNCPMCMEPRRLLLLHVRDGLMDDGFHVVRCEACGCLHDVPRPETEAALAAVELYSMLDRGAISSFDYGSRFAALGFSTVLKLDREGEYWRCPSCVEKVPGNFVECWNCQAVRPGFDGSLEVPHNAEPPELPRTSIVNNPDKPWEG